MTAAVPRALRELAALHGIQSAYRGIDGRMHRASADAVIGALRAMGVAVEGVRDVAGEVRERRLALWQQPLEPVSVAWEGRPATVAMRVPAKVADRRIDLSLILEDASERRLGSSVARQRAEDVEGDRFVELGVPLPRDLPRGYHRVRVEANGLEASSMLVCAPRRAPEGPRGWGVFLPIYAIRSARSAAIGDLTDLGDLLEWTAGLGGSAVATTPLLAAFLREPFEPGPYSPASRLFWNEIYLDVDAIPGRWPRTPRAFAPGRLVDYRAIAEEKRSALEPAAEAFFARGDGDRRWASFRAFLRAAPLARDFARFMATGERRRAPWPAWPALERDGRLASDGGNPLAYRFHLFAQWQMAEQMRRLADQGRASGAGLYVDAPVGVHAASFDVWRERGAFAMEASAGAPPDPFFAHGQDWGFHPLHPDGVREQEYRYPIACLRHLLPHASVLRIDHVMGLHRLYWVMPGLPATDGVYVRYRPEEAYAILALEAHRHGTAIVGEDLGTVPRHVRSAMARHGVRRSFVLQWALRPDARHAVAPPPRASTAALNTHDMPPFAAFWHGDDLRLRQAQGWLTAREAKKDRSERTRLLRALVGYLRLQGRLAGDRGTGRPPGLRAVLRAALEHLAASEAEMIVVNLEDLWLERQPQNVPGTTVDQPNWRRPARYRFEEFRERPEVTGTLQRIDAIRRRERGERG